MGVLAAQHNLDLALLNPAVRQAFLDGGALWAFFFDPDNLFGILVHRRTSICLSTCPIGSSVQNFTASLDGLSVIVLACWQRFACQGMRA